MRGTFTSGSGNQDRREPPFKGKKRKGKKKRRGAKGRHPVERGPLHAAMVNAAT